MKSRIGIIGSGWRTDFFLRAIAAHPEEFSLVGVVSRDPGAKADWAAERGITSLFADIRTLLEAKRPDFVVVSVPANAALGPLKTLSGLGIPILLETPAAVDLEGLVAVWDLHCRGGALIEVAEQYPLQPMHAARLGLVAESLLGDIQMAQVAQCHGYHGICLLRRYLGTAFEPVTIRAHSDPLRVVRLSTRTGPPSTETIEERPFTQARLEFGDKLGLFEFDPEQYFSPIRSGHVLVRGTRGEIRDDAVRFLTDYPNVAFARLERISGGEQGSLHPPGLREIQFAGRSLYRNPNPGARLSDEELAVAETLRRMVKFAQDRKPGSCYSLANACEDRYLDLLMEDSIRTGSPVSSTPQLWHQAHA